MIPDPLLNRREFLRTGLMAAASLPSVGPLLAWEGCSRGRSTEAGGSAFDTAYQSAVRAAEVAGPAREVRLVADVGEVEVGPRGVYRTWLYNGEFPGPEIRVREGERLRVTLGNHLPEETTVHWHGVPVPNPMDGVPGVTQDPVPPRGTFVYDYVARPSGSYMYHSHVGLQLDRGLLGSLVIEERTPHVSYDREYTVVLDDFLPDEPRPVAGGMMSRDVPRYAALLINGRPPEDPPALEITRGERVRLRLLNPGSGNTFRVAVAGHPMTVTHTDGRPVRPVEVDALLIGMGERYDVVIEANNPGTWALVAASIRRGPAPARAVLRYQGSREPAPADGEIPEGLRGGRLLSLADLQSVETTGEASGSPDRTFDLTLSGGMMSSAWTIDGQAYPNAEPLEIREGERVRVRMGNMSMMPHPMHLHGHFFQVGGALKETVLVPPHMGRLTFDFTADHPGDWFFHCHNLYHMESGMARVFRYV
jgi:FtsP/CotA-like multicopper oxidase with cupredoxin domain